MQTNRQSFTFLNIAADWKTNPRILVVSSEQLRTLLSPLSKREPGFVELESPTSGLLQLGIGKFACAQLTTRDDKPRYLAAKARTIRATSDVEFMCGGTPTPIAPELCLSPEEVISIAEHFFRTGDRDPSFEWVEI